MVHKTPTSTSATISGSTGGEGDNSCTDSSPWAPGITSPAPLCPWFRSVYKVITNNNLS